MNRRSFLGTMLALGTAAKFLPAALTYGRPWKPVPSSPILLPAKDIEPIYYDGTITLTYCTPLQSGKSLPGDRFNVNGTEFLVNSVRYERNWGEGNDRLHVTGYTPLTNKTPYDLIVSPAIIPGVHVLHTQWSIEREHRFVRRC
jgi:hypothetical protein